MDSRSTAAGRRGLGEKPERMAGDDGAAHCRLTNELEELCLASVIGSIYQYSLAGSALYLLQHPEV